MESDMNFGVRLTFRSGPDLPFPSYGTLGMSLYLLSSIRHITDVQKRVNDSAGYVLFLFGVNFSPRAHIQSVVGTLRGLF